MTALDNANGVDAFSALSDPLSDSAFRANMEVSWPLIFQLTRGEIVTEQPIVVRRASGRRLDDVIWTTFAIPIIVSERIVNLLQENGFTGWTTYPITLYAKTGVVVPGYSGLSVTGRCGTADWSRSQRVLRQYPACVSPVWRGLHISDWDGSDFFMASAGATGYKFVTNRVRTVIERECIGNVKLEAIAELETRMDPES